MKMCIVNLVQMVQNVWVFLLQTIHGGAEGKSCFLIPFINLLHNLQFVRKEFYIYKGS